MSNHNQHWAVFCSIETNTNDFIHSMLNNKAKEPFGFLNEKKGVLFSPATIKEFIEEESKRDYTILNRADKRTIRTFSSGEQKVAMLDYLLLQNPHFIILDNVFDNLDTNNHQIFFNKLSQVSDKIIFIQIIQRKTDWLPFIHHAVSLNNHQQFTAIDNIENFIQQTNTTIHHSYPIPPPVHTYDFNSSIVEFKNVTVSYDENIILKNINWEIQTNEFWQLKGANGSGKTTLLTMITGDNVKGYGKELYLFGTKKGSGETVWDIKQKIGYVTPAMTDLFSTRHTVEEMILSGFYDSIGLYVIPSERTKELTKEWLHVLNMQQMKHKIFCELPLGLQRKILIARSMVKHPPLLILDEPAYGLDDKNTEMIIDLINQFSKESNTSIVYVSHRDEKNLKPQFIFQLTKTNEGSVGIII